jgi:hypothetical protein
VLEKVGMPIEGDTFYQLSKDEKDYVTKLVKIGPDGNSEKFWHPGPFAVIDRHGRTCTPHPNLEYTLAGGQDVSQVLSHPKIAPWAATTSVNQNPTEGLTMLEPPRRVQLKQVLPTFPHSSHPSKRAFDPSTGDKGPTYLSGQLEDVSLERQGRNRYPGWDNPGHVDYIPYDWPKSRYPQSDGGSSEGPVEDRW